MTRFDPETTPQDPECREAHSMLGSYLLGSCPPADERRMREHLEHCEEARLALEDLRPVLVALHEQPRERDEQPLAPSGHVRRSILADVRADASLFAAAQGMPVADDAPSVAPAPVAPVDAARGRVPADGSTDRRRAFRSALGGRRPVAGLVVTLVLLVVAGSAVVIGSGGSSGDGSRTVVASVRAAQAPSGHARLLVKAGNADPRLEVTGLPAAGAGKKYQLWVLRDGATVPEPSRAATFTVDGRGSRTVALPDRLNPRDTVMLTAEPAAGSATPTGKPVLSARV